VVDYRGVGMAAVPRVARRAGLMVMVEGVLPVLVAMEAVRWVVAAVGKRVAVGLVEAAVTASAAAYLAWAALKERAWKVQGT